MVMAVRPWHVACIHTPADHRRKALLTVKLLIPLSLCMIRAVGTEESRRLRAQVVFLGSLSLGFLHFSANVFLTDHKRSIYT